MSRQRRLFPVFSGVLTLLCCLVSLRPAEGWWVKGHGIIAQAAASRLPDEMPAFFRNAGKTLNYLAGEPDRWKNKSAPLLTAAIAPDHYLDLEDLEGNDLPRDRYKLIELMRKLGKVPDKAGFLPYAIQEHFDQLTIAFADYRKDPDNEAVRMKCLVYAGILAHYTGDACMPLHTTRNYDGKPGPDGRMQQKGIHAKIDAFPETFGLTWEEMGLNLELRPVENSFPHIVGVLKESYKHIDRCYELDLENAFEKPTPASRAFILDRCRAAAQFTGEMWLAAWKRSANVVQPY
jgi:hypothetical protein